MPHAATEKTAEPQEPGPGRAPRRRHRRVAAGVVIVLVAAGAAVALADLFHGPSRPGAGAGSGGRTSLATVTRQGLVSQTTVNATLGYAGSYTVAGKASGTITWLPAAGRLIRQGGVLYRIDNGTPVFLLYGRVPAWRALSEGAHGADVRQLNHDLVALGYGNRTDVAALGWKYFGWDTKAALQDLQEHLGLPQTGALPLGQAVFEPAAIRVSAVPASLGNPASGVILTATSARLVVTIALDAAQQSEVKTGDKVTITLPDGTTTPGRITSVGKVATTTSGTATIPVQVALQHPKAAGGLDQAPVTVAITQASVKDALVVPVNALLARASGGYEVEEVTVGGRRHLVRVSVGLFDNAAGMVQVSGSGLAAGQRVVVPAL